MLRASAFGLAVIALIFGVLVFMAWQQDPWADQTTESVTFAEFADSDGTNGHSTHDDVARSVYLDIKDADVKIRPALPGEFLGLTATFDPRFFALEPQGDDAENFTVRFRRSGPGGMAMLAFRELLGAERSKVVLTVPPDESIALRLNVESCLTQVDLEGLHLRSLEAEVADCDFVVDATGAVAGMKVLRVDARQTRVFLEGVGHASPAEIELDQIMGVSEVDLTGPWINDADIEFESQMATQFIQLPANVRVHGLAPNRSRLEVSREGLNPELPGPELRIKLERSLGTVKVEVE